MFGSYLRRSAPLLPAEVETEPASGDEFVDYGRFNPIVAARESARNHLYFRPLLSLTATSGNMTCVEARISVCQRTSNSGVPIQYEVVDLILWTSNQEIVPCYGNERL